MSAAIRVLVISPRTLIRAGLGAVLRGQPQIQVVGQVDDPRDAANLQFGIALLDAGNSRPKPAPFRFLVLLPQDDDARGWLDEGAAGCILETATVEELLNAIRQAARGEIFLPPPIAQQMVASLAVHAASRAQPVEPLTDRERQVLRLLAQGMNNKDIAQKLYLSVRTVEGHLANIYGKLQVKSRTEAAVWAVQNL